MKSKTFISTLLMMLLLFVTVIGGTGCGGGSSSNFADNEPEPTPQTTYTVTFDSNGGSSVASQSVVEGNKAIEPTAPTRNGYTFGGWYSDSGLTIRFSFNTPITANITLYARWNAPSVTTYIVTFNSNGGSEVPSQNVVAGEQAVAPANPTREGYSFAGWYSDEGLTERFAFTTAITQNITLYASWDVQAIMYTVAFDSNGGSYVAEQEVEEEELAQQPDDPELEGYVFLAWLDEDGEIFNFNSPIYDNRTLVAEWLKLAEATDDELTEIKDVVFGGKVSFQTDSPDFAPLTDVEVTYDFIDNAGVVEISPLTDSPVLGVAGLIGLPVNIKSDLSEFEKTTITFHYDPELLTVSPNDLGIVWYDESNDQMVLLSNDVTINTSTNAIQFTADHFSIYGVVSVSQWEAVWSQRIAKVRSEDVNYNVILILDISGSMVGSPINDAVASARNLVDALADDDYVAVLYFSDYAKEVVPTTKIENNKTTIKSAIYVPSYYEMNGTDIQSALNLSLNYNKADLTNLVVLLSDGYSYSVYDSVLQQLKDNNMKVITVGLGSSVDTALMERIANATNGGYVYVSDSGELQEKFEEIANADLGVEDTDDDHDGLPDALEKSGLKDLFQHEWQTDPTNPDTDGDGILDGDEIRYDPNLYFCNVRYVSNPLLTTESEDESMVSIPEKVYCTVDDLNSRRLTFKFPITNYLYKQYNNKEVFYPAVKIGDLSYTIVDLPEGFTSTGNVSISKGNTKKTDDGTQETEVDYWASFSVTYPVNQSRTLKAVNIKHDDPSSTMILTWIDVPVEYVNTQIRSQAVEQAEKAYQNLEKQYIQALMKAMKAVQEDDSEIKDTSASLETIAREIHASPSLRSPQTKGEVPKEVYQAVAEVLAKAIKDSAVTEYNMSLEELVTKPMNFITGFMREWAQSIENISQQTIQTVTIGNTSYIVEINTKSFFWAAYLDQTYVRSGEKEWLLSWAMDNKQLNTALGNYCAILLQLSESIVEEFWQIYINSFLTEIGSPKTVSQAMVHNAGLVIKVLCGGKTGEDAAKELATVTVQYIKSKAQDVLKQRLQTIDGKQFMAEIENVVKNLPDGKGKTFIDIASRLNNISKKYEDLKEALEAYKSFSRGSGGSVSQAISDVEKAYKGFKSVYDDLNDESIFTS